MQLLKIGNQLIQVGGGVRYWADAPDAAEDWGANAIGFFISQEMYKTNLNYS